MSEKPGEKAQEVGKALESCGCIMVLIPLIIIFGIALVLILYSIVTSMFH